MEYVNYDVGSVEDAIHSLEAYGVVVLPNQFSVDECEEFRHGLWRGIQHVTQGRFDVEDVATWDEFYKFQPKKSMLLKSWIGHLQPIWQHPTVCNVFCGTMEYDTGQFAGQF